MKRRSLWILYFSMIVVFHHCGGDGSTDTGKDNQTDLRTDTAEKDMAGSDGEDMAGEDGLPKDSVAPDGSAGDMADATVEDGAGPDQKVDDTGQTGDSGGSSVGQSCDNPVVLTLDGDQAQYSGTTWKKNDNVDFQEKPCPGTTWAYSNYDMIHKLSVPDGLYLAILHPEDNRYDSALILVATNDCDGFETSCIDYSDAPVLGTDEWIAFETTADKSYYLVVDSSRDPWMSFEEETSGPYTLTVKKWEYKALGDSCAKDYECSSQGCLDINDDGKKNCTDYCAFNPSVCETASIEMACMDVSKIYGEAGLKVCVPEDIIDIYDNGHSCAVDFECKGRACVYLQYTDFEGVCYTSCLTAACSSAEEECIDVTADIQEFYTTKVCLLKSTKNSVTDGNACSFSYECLQGSACVSGLCIKQG